MIAMEKDRSYCLKNFTNCSFNVNWCATLWTYLSQLVSARLHWEQLTEER